MSNSFVSLGQNIIGNNKEKYPIINKKSVKSTYNPKNYNEIKEYSDEDEEENLDKSKTTANSIVSKSKVHNNKNLNNM